MPSIKILTERELADCVALDADAIVCIENCFRTLATEQVAMPPILRLDIPEHRGEVDVKTAYLPGVPCFAIKISPGFFDNPKLGLPSVNGLMLLLSARTGLVEAVLLDNGYLTNVRTAAAGAVAAQWLARRDARSAGVLGAGVQAKLQLEALTLVRDVERVLVWARDAAKAKAFAETAGREAGPRDRRRVEPRRSRAAERDRDHDDAEHDRPWCWPTGCSPGSTSPPWAPMPSTRTSWRRTSSSAPAISAIARASVRYWASCTTPSLRAPWRRMRPFRSSVR